MIDSPALNILLTTAITAAVTFAVGLLTVQVQRRAAKTQETQAASAAQTAVVGHWQTWAETQVTAREKVEARLEELHTQLQDTRQRVRRLENRLGAAVAYIRQLLAWAGEVKHDSPYPPIPADVREMIDENTTYSADLDA